MALFTPEGVRVAACRKLIENNFDVEKTVGWTLEHYKELLYGHARMNNRAVTVARRIITMGGSGPEQMLNIQCMEKAMRLHIQGEVNKVRAEAKAEIDMQRQNSQEDRQMANQSSKAALGFAEEANKSKDNLRTAEQSLANIMRENQQMALNAPEPPSPAPPPTPPPGPVKPQAPPAPQEPENAARGNFQPSTDFPVDEELGF